MVKRNLFWGLVVALVGCGYGDSADPEQTSGSRPARDDGVSVVKQALINPATILLDTGTDVGATPGGFWVGSDGSANYRIPLWTPDSVSDATRPSLALRYSSAAGDGLMGLGWDVEGLSQITRCTKGGRLTETPKPIRFLVGDPLCMDGLRLVYLPGDSGGALPGNTGAVYHTEPDQFARIKITGHDSRGPLSFEVRARDGRIHTYGALVEGMQQTITASATNPTSPVSVLHSQVRFRWLLSKTEDRFGNRMVFQWSLPQVVQGQAQEPRPLRIDYGGGASDTLRRSVVFHYENRPAEGQRKWWQAGFAFQRNLRLGAVEMRAPNPTTVEAVRWYKISYLESATSKRQLVNAVQECDRDPSAAVRSCMRATELSYEQSLDTFQLITTNVNDIRLTQAGYEKFWRLMVADLNNDGRDDVLYRNGRNWKYSLSTCSADLTGCGYASGTTLDIAPDLAGGATAKPYDPVIADFNLDGIPDIAGINPNVPNQYFFYTGLSNGANYNSNFHSWEYTGEAGATAGLWVFAPEGKFGPSIFRPLSTGIWGSFQAETWTFAPVEVRSNSEVIDTVGWEDTDVTKSWNSYVADVDGDGAPDMLGRRPLEGQTDIKRLVATRAGFSEHDVTTLPISEPTGTTRRYMFADLNGDGLQEAVQLMSGTSAPRVAVNTGNGFAEAAAQTLPTDANITLGSTTKWGDLNDPGVRIMDFDGDGRDDLLLVDDGRKRESVTSSQTRTQLKVLLSRNSGLVKKDLSINLGQAANGADAFPSGGPSNWLLSQVLDANGDGRPDIALVRNGVLELYVRNGKKADMLTGIKDGMGLKRSVNYEPMSKHTVYSVNQPQLCLYPQGCPQNGHWIVESHRIDNGNGTAQNKTSYRYYDYTVDAETGTPLGFKRIDTQLPTHNPALPRTVRQGFDLSTVETMNIEGESVRIYPGLGRPQTITDTTYVNAAEYTTVDTTYAHQVVRTHGDAPISSTTAARPWRRRTRSGCVDSSIRRHPSGTPTLAPSSWSRARSPTPKNTCRCRPTPMPRSTTTPSLPPSGPTGSSESLGSRTGSARRHP